MSEYAAGVANDSTDPLDLDWNAKSAISAAIQPPHPLEVLQREKEEIKSKLLETYEALHDTEEKGDDELGEEEIKQQLKSTWQQLALNFSACQAEHVQHLLADSDQMQKLREERSSRWFHISDALEFYIETVRQNIADLEDLIPASDQRSRRLMYFCLAISGVVLDYFAPEQQQQELGQGHDEVEDKNNTADELTRFHEDELVTFLAHLMKACDFLCNCTLLPQPLDEYSMLADALKEHIPSLGVPETPAILQIMQYVPETEGDKGAVQQTNQTHTMRSPRNVDMKKKQLEKKKKNVSFSLPKTTYSDEKAQLQVQPRSRSPARELDMRLWPSQIHCSDEGWIGGGTFGDVYCGLLTKDGEGRMEVAIKVAQEHELDTLQDCMIQEAAVMAKIASSAAASRGVIAYYGAGYLTLPGEPVFLVTELATCSLRNLIRDAEHLSAFEQRTNSRLDLAAKLRVLLQVAGALVALHEIGIFHSNLKPENVLLCADGTAKLSDAGLALPLQAFRAYVADGTALVESIFYTDSELLADASANYAASTDVYSFAVIANEFLGQLPRAFEVSQDQINLLSRRNFRPRLCEDAQWDKHDRKFVGALQFLIRSAWDADCDRRPSLPSIVAQLSDILIELSSCKAEKSTVASSSAAAVSTGAAGSISAISELRRPSLEGSVSSNSEKGSRRSSGSNIETSTGGAIKSSHKALEDLTQIEAKNFLSNVDVIGFVEANKRDAFFEARLTGKNLKKICDSRDPHAMLQQLYVLAIKTDDFLAVLLEHDLNGVPGHLLLPQEDARAICDTESDMSSSFLKNTSMHSLNDSIHSVSTKGMSSELTVERSMELLYRKVRYGPPSFAEYQQLTAIAKRCDGIADASAMEEAQIAASFLACLFMEVNATIRQKDFEQARNYALLAQSWMEANEQHNCYALTNLAVCHLYNLLSKITRAAVFSMFLRAVQNQRGYQRAACYLGECFEHGTGTDVDVGKARQLYERFAAPSSSSRSSSSTGSSKPFPHALFLLGKSHLSLDTQGGGDLQLAFRNILAAANKEHVEAKYFLGLCYFHGYGTAEDLDAAKRLFKNEHVQKLKPRALVMLGNCYCDRQRAMKVFSGDNAKAFKAFQAAAAAGVAEGVHCLALCFWDGTGVQQSYVKAFELFKQAADLSYREAYVSLYHCYHSGRGAPVDQSKADECIIEAARLGSKDAKKMCDSLRLNYK